MKINDQVIMQKEHKEVSEKIQKAKKEVRVGVLPTYLVNRKKQGEIERKKMMHSIELNKRPQGTIRLTDGEISQMRVSLQSEKQKLSNQIE